MDPINDTLPPDPMAGAPANFMPPDPAVQAMPPMAEKGDLIVRDPPEPEPARAELVQQLMGGVKAAKGKWGSVFRRMRYVANIVQRHVQQRTAVLYAKNPKAVAKRKERIDYTVWDGTSQQFMQAEQAMQQAALMGQPPEPIFAMIVKDHADVMSRRQLVDRIGKTMEILYQYYIDEQVHTFKAEMKRAVRRTITCGVSYVKLGYQRIMQKTPDIERQMSDFQMQLANLQRLSADIADGETDPNSAESERLKLMIQALSAAPEVLLREGLMFDFPASTAVIPDSRCRSLKTFAGCDWVAEEFLMSAAEVAAVYQKDVGTGYNAYTDAVETSPSLDFTLASMSGAFDPKGAKRDVLVWLIYHIKDGLVYTIADGYPDFLEEPAPPAPMLERFWPWFTLMFNELEHESEVFPLSDVRLLRHQQQDYNRSREGLREHRQANRPMTVTANGTLDDEDRNKLQTRPANAVVELNGLQPGQDVKTVLQPWQGPPLDPNLYDPAPVFQDVLRVERNPRSRRARACRAWSRMSMTSMTS
jgi:TfoX/Sxy family transcriptional regulator of competence genes